MSKQAQPVPRSVDWHPDDFVLLSFTLDDDTYCAPKVISDTGTNYLPTYLLGLTVCRSRRRPSLK
jgi:hypothetical protein